MKNASLALATSLAAQFLFVSTSFASQLPDAPKPTTTLSQYEHCLALEEAGIIPLVPCYILKEIEDAKVPVQTEEKAEVLSQYEHCLALEAKGIIPFVPCYLLKQIEDSQADD